MFKHMYQIGFNFHIKHQTCINCLELGVKVKEVGFMTPTNPNNNNNNNNNLLLLLLWGQRTYDPAHFPLRLKACAEEGSCRGRVGKGQIA